MDERPEPPPPQVFIVQHENWNAWRAFDACRTQWRLPPMGGFLGLDYTALELVMRARSIPIQTLPDVQEIEAGALAEFQQHKSDS